MTFRTTIGSRLAWIKWRISSVLPGATAAAAVVMMGAFVRASTAPLSGWHIARTIVGIRTHVPTHAPANNFPDGPLLGNGSLGVAVQGRNTDHISLYLGRENFWSLLRGRIMPFGRVIISIPALHNGGYRTTVFPGTAEVRGQFTGRNGRELRFTAWTACRPMNAPPKPRGAREDLLVVKLRNTGKGPLKISTALLDAWGTRGAAGMAGRTAGVDWLRVSPDTVRARIGLPTGLEKYEHFQGRIKDVRIFGPVAGEQSTLRPLYTFLAARQGKSIPAGHVVNTHLDCGYLRIPQRAFRLSLHVRPRLATGTQAIFSAMTTKRWTHWPGGGQPRIPYGLSLSLNQGKVSVMLNRVRITANRALPLHHWTHVQVSYDGRRLVLTISGRQAAQSTGFPSTAQVAGPQWDWNAIHPGDPQLPFDGCGPDGLIGMRIVGTAVHGTAASDSITLQARQSATILISAMDSRDTPDFHRASITLLSAVHSGTLARLWQLHLAWWRNFWNKSAVEIPQKTILDSYYGSLYLFACSSAPNHIAPGLWGNFITSPWMAWNGDYTLDYNYEAPYWSAYPTNHVALADNYDMPILAWMARGRGLAKLRGYKGLFYHCHLSPPPGWSADGARSLQQKCDALFGSVDCLMRWRYTRSRKYARMVYPFLRGVATFWDHYLVLKNGVYMDYNDAADERQHPHDVNPATSIAFLHMLYPGLLDMNTALALHDPDARIWRHILHHLAPLPIVPAASVTPIVRAVGRAAVRGKFVIRNALIGSDWIRLNQLLSAHPPLRATGSSAGMNSHQAIFPGWAIGLESGRKELTAALNTVRFQKTWYDFNNTSSFYPACAAIGYKPERILFHLHTLIRHFSYPNFVFQMGGGGTENFATVPVTICNMFLQSYQRNIHVFPDWPRNQNAAFRHLLACGDFLVSSRIAGGRIEYVVITSLRGGQCRIANPWPDHPIRAAIRGGKTSRLSGAVLRVGMVKGQRLKLQER